MIYRNPVYSTTETLRVLDSAHTYALRGIRVRGVENPQGFGIDKRRLIENEEYRHAIEFGRKKGVIVFIIMPRIIKNMNELPDFFSPQRTQSSQIDLSPDGFLVSNPGVLYHLRNQDSMTPIVLDYPFNIFNRLTMQHHLR